MSRKVEAWAIIDGNGEGTTLVWTEKHAKELMRDYPEDGETLVHLIPAPDPKLARLDAAVLRLTREWANDRKNHYAGEESGPDGDLWRAVSRREKALKSGKR